MTPFARTESATWTMVRRWAAPGIRAAGWRAVPGLGKPAFEGAIRARLVTGSLASKGTTLASPGVLPRLLLRARVAAGLPDRPCRNSLSSTPKSTRGVLTELVELPAPGDTRA